MISRRLSKNGWTVWHLVSAAVLVSAAILVTWRSVAQIVELGLTRAVAGHVFLVPIVSAWLFWVRRRRMYLCRPSGSIPGLILAVLGAAAFVYGEKRVHPTLFHLGAVLLPTGCLAAILGQQVLKSYLPAFLVLLALVPPPIAWAERLARPLQVATGELVCWLYSLFGVDASLSGDHLRIGEASLRLTDVCGGLPMAMSLALVSYGFVFGTPLRNSVRFVVMLLSPLSAVLCSAFALLATFWLYEAMPLEIADVWLRVSEWAMLLVAFLLLICIIRLLTWASVPVRQYPLAYDQ